MKKILLPMAFMIVPFLPAGAAQDANLLLAEAVEAAKSQRVPDDYAYKRHLRVEAEDEKTDRLEQYDPARPKNERWTLLAVDGRSPKPADLSDYDPDEGDGIDINGADVPAELYTEIVGDIDVADAKLIEETETYAVFAIDDSVARFLEDEQAEFADKIIGRLRLEKGDGKPYVSDLRVYAPEPIRAFIGTGFDRFELRFSFARHPEGGHILPERFRFDMDMQALLFISVEVLTEISYDEWVWRGGSGI